MNEIILDSNVFVLFIIGLINPKRINSHKRTSIYSEDDFKKLYSIISQYKTIITSPNVITEIDNLLNNLTGIEKFKYNLIIQDILDKSLERYFESRFIAKDWIFNEIGLTDAVIINMAKNSDLLISDDSQLCDIARSHNINVFDLKEYVNIKYS